MQKLIALILSILLFFPLQRAAAWGQEGHRIIGQIAYDNLSKKARRQLDQLLGEKGLVYWANWADEIKSDTIYPTSGDWHFQDLNAGMSDEEVIRTLTDYPAEGGNLWRTMDSLVALLQREPDNVDAARFVIHLFGDCFCPMHTAHMDDLGGNRVPMKWFGANSNLHRVWDSDLIRARGYSYSEYAEYLEKTFATERQKVETCSREEWLVRNYALTSEIYAYQSDWDGNTYHYVYHFAPRLEYQLYAAGIRLALLLNELYG